MPSSADKRPPAGRPRPSLLPVPNAVDPDELADLREIVAADVAHLRNTWADGMDPHVLRREAVTLRRLLVDNGGDLARLWRMLGREGQPTIQGGFDLREFPHWRGLAFGTADVMPVHGGAELGGVMLWEQEAMKDPEIAAVMAQPPGDGTMPLRQYVEAVCIVITEKPVRRLDLITYLTNNRGGAHFDRRGRAGDPQRRAAHELLDRARREGMAINQQEAAFGQLIAIARNVVHSLDVQWLAAQAWPN